MKENYEEMKKNKKLKIKFFSLTRHIKIISCERGK